MPKRIFLSTLILVLALAACTLPGGNVFGKATATPTASPTPTATPIPLAVSINGEGVTVSDFDAELARYQQAQTALGNTVNLEEATQAAMDNLVDTVLLAQGAAAQGYSLDESALQSRIDDLAAQIGGPEALTAWESAHGYTEEQFRSELRREIAAAWMRDQLAAAVPATTEQIHLKQILLYSADSATEALGYLNSGWDFEELAARYDPITKGELGWIPRGYLPDENLEEIAFALQPGQHSDIVQTSSGYHILFAAERDADHALSPEARLTLQERATQDWLVQQRENSQIIFAP